MESIVPILGVPDVRASVDWYCTTLGFACPPDGIFEPPGDDAAVYAILVRGDIGLHLQIRRREVFAGPRESIESDAYLYVDDVDALYDEAVSQGVNVLRELYDEPYGIRDFTIETPDGHRIVFGTPLDVA